MNKQTITNFGFEKLWIFVLKAQNLKLYSHLQKYGNAYFWVKFVRALDNVGHLGFNCTKDHNLGDFVLSYTKTVRKWWLYYYNFSPGLMLTPCQLDNRQEILTKVYSNILSWHTILGSFIFPSEEPVTFCAHVELFSKSDWKHSCRHYEYDMHGASLH